MEDGGKLLRLGLAFEVVDAHRRDVEKNESGRGEEDHFFSYDDKGASQALDGPAVPCELQNAEDAEKADDTDGAEVDAEAEIERENGGEINQPEETENIRSLRVRHGDSQGVFHGEQAYGPDFNPPEYPSQLGRRIRERFHGERDQRDQHESLNAQIKQPPEFRIRFFDYSPEIHRPPLVLGPPECGMWK